MFSQRKVRSEEILQLVLLREVPDDQQLASQWNALVQQMERPEVFYTYEWALAVQRAYAASLTPLLILAYQDSSLVGVVALATDGGGEVFFLAATTADYCDFVCRPEDTAKLLDAVLIQLKILALPTLRLANLPADSETVRSVLSRAHGHGYFLFSRPAYTCSQIRFSSQQQRDPSSNLCSADRSFVAVSRLWTELLRSLLVI